MAAAPSLAPSLARNIPAHLAARHRKPRPINHNPRFLKSAKFVNVALDKSPSFDSNQK
jgi:hypothetical protein